MSFHVYILQSDKDGSLYVGHTSNIDERLLRHNQGRSIYTKSKKPWTLLHTETFETKASAAKREHELKALHRKDLILQLVKSPR